MPRVLDGGRACSAKYSFAVLKRARSIDLGGGVFQAPTPSSPPGHCHLPTEHCTDLRPALAPLGYRRSPARMSTGPWGAVVAMRGDRIPGICVEMAL